MFKNYLKTAFRNLLREKSSTFINISGLTLGITCSLVLFLMVRHLTSFDNFQTNYSRIFRVVTESDGNDRKNYTSGIPPVLPDAFRQDFPEAEEVTFTSYRSGVMVSIPQSSGAPKKYKENEGVVFTQSNFFKIFDRAILIGSAEKSLDDPNQAVISKSLALKYFGKEDVIGENVKYDSMEYTIRAVMADPPTNTDFPFTLMLSYSSIKAVHDQEGWNSIWSDEQCYFITKKGEPVEKIESRMQAFTDKYLGKENYGNQKFTIQPMKEFHSDERYGSYSHSSAPPEMMITLSVIAVFLIVTACINFINLSTAEAIKRSKEVGIRKSLGSTRMQLVRQFLGETTMVTVGAMLISLALAQLALSYLNNFLDMKLTMDFSGDPALWVFIIGVTVLVSLLSGLYPSLVISGYKPTQALKNLVSNKNSSGYHLRRGLVVFQFVISQFLIIGTIVIVSQMRHFQKQELGFRKDAIIVVPIPLEEAPSYGDGTSKMRTLRNELLRVPGIEETSLSSTPPSSGSVSGTSFTLDGETDDKSKRTQVKQVDGNYLSLYDVKLIAGENLADLDTAVGFVVNKRFAEVCGFNDPSEMLGKVVHMWGKQLPVVGVVNNFNTMSLRRGIEPVILLNRIRGYETVSLKLKQSDMQGSIKTIQEKWEATYPEHIFEYDFLDEQIREFYEGDRKMSTLLSVFTSIAIFIGCLGLFGLATFMTNQKTKEIGVRKVLGASVESIITLFTKEYVKLILIGFVIAAPFAWFVMNEYLKDFAYKITIGPVVFLIGLSVTLGIAMLTVGYKSFKAAVINPVKALRYE